MSEQPVVVACVGMAGSGKTTFMQRINSHLHSKKQPPYVLNLDPAVLNVPFESNIDIRDTVNYKEVMRQYNLGPNGGILTSMNLFATKVDQVLSILEKRTKPSQSSPESTESKSTSIKHILVDTPGQIEVFVWSASGDIILGSLASSFPTVLAYIIDTPRSASTSTFMSNMLYACSILYKTKLPMILVFNKTDVKDADFATEWMTDFEAFQDAVREEDEAANSIGGQGSGYMGSLLHSMSLMLEEFYRHLKVVGVSSATGAGVEDFFEAVDEKAKEFETDYKPELERRRKQRAEEKELKREADLGRLMADLEVQDRGKRQKDEPETVSEAEEEEDDDDDVGGLVDPDEDDEMEDEEDADDGLTKRYKDALKESGGPKDGDDFGFVKYLHTQNIG